MRDYGEDPRRAEAQAMPMADVVARLDLTGLQKHSHELIGPCPRCGGRDRFGINLRKGVFGCRRCEGKGGGIDLVMFVLGLDFPGALRWLCGEATEIDPAERARRIAVAQDNKRRQDIISANKRREAIVDAQRIWSEGRAPEGSPVRDYLTRRGIRPDLFRSLPVSLRFHPALPFMVQVGRDWVEVHRGPAMLAAVQGPDDKFCAVHRTWLNLALPKGKAVITHPETGEVLPSKKVLGSKKGGAVRLSRSDGDTLVMGEGIETTLSALVADAIQGARYWAGVDLGNMSGQRRMGKGLRFEGIPDLGDTDAFVPPAWVTRLIYVQDGDSDPQLTRAKLVAGLRRAKALRPGLRAQIVHAGAGRDLNDVLLTETET